MRIVTSKQMKQIEQNSIQYQMSYLRLMENAGCAAARFILETLRAVSGLNCVVFCGKGNNGGDGFVVARKLSEQGANVTVVLADGEPKTPDAIQMLSLVRTMQLPVFSFEDEPEAVSAAMDEVDVIVDAIYGSGFHGEIDIRRRQITQMINEAIAAVFSLDIPSGINCDTGEAAQDAVNADFTIAFDSYKPAHLLPKYLPGLGQVSLAPIGVDPLSYEGVAQNHFVADEDYVYSRIPQRQPDAHKTSTGKLLNIAGGIGCTGAAVLSSTAAMRSGAGYVVTGVPQAIYPIIAPSLVQSPFCFIETAADVAGALTGASAIAIGCGMGTGQRQRGILEEVLYLAKCPVVIDADGINNLAMDISIVADAKCPVILTPHFGEMAKICRTSVSEIQKAPLLCAQELAAQLIPESAKESLDTLTEIAAWIQEHPDDASAMNAAIEALQAVTAGIGGEEDDYATVVAAIEGKLAAALATITAGGTNGHLSVGGTDVTVYTHPAHTPQASGLYKITVDAEGHVSAAAAVEKADITGLGIPVQDTTYAPAVAGGANGLLTGADKQKLDGVAEGATKVEASTTAGNIKINGAETPVVQIATDTEVTEMIGEVFPAA